jgi:hypothetical protein
MGKRLYLGKRFGKQSYERLGRKWKDNIKIDLREI